MIQFPSIFHTYELYPLHYYSEIIIEAFISQDIILIIMNICIYIFLYVPVQVLMNKAVVEYYKSDLKKTDTFRKQLFDICAKVGICMVYLLIL